VPCALLALQVGNDGGDDAAEPDEADEPPEPTIDPKDLWKQASRAARTRLHVS
jgi:hypothetical protein